MIKILILLSTLLSTHVLACGQSDKPKLTIEPDKEGLMLKGLGNCSFMTISLPSEYKDFSLGNIAYEYDNESGQMILNLAFSAKYQEDTISQLRICISPESIEYSKLRVVYKPKPKPDGSILLCFKSFEYNLNKYIK